MGRHEPGVAEAAHEAAVAPRARKTREETKQAIIIAIQRAEGGATIAEIAAATAGRRTRCVARCLER